MTMTDEIALPSLCRVIALDYLDKQFVHAQVDCPSRPADRRNVTSIHVFTSHKTVTDVTLFVWCTAVAACYMSHSALPQY